MLTTGLVSTTGMVTLKGLVTPTGLKRPATDDNFRKLALADRRGFSHTY